jgi:hypothetical protein
LFEVSAPPLVLGCLRRQQSSSPLAPLFGLEVGGGRYGRAMDLGAFFSGLAVAYWLVIIAAALVRALFGVTEHRTPTAEELDPEAFYGDED